MFRPCRFIWVLILALVTGCSTVKGWFSDDEFDPREPVELQKITEQVKLKSRWSISALSSSEDLFFQIVSS